MPEYHEDGMICDVTVLEDTSDEKWHRYKLRVNKILQSSAIFKDPKVNDEFCVQQVKGECFNGMWHLFGYDHE